MSDYDFVIVDKLAHAYGWSIEYISQCDVREISGLLKAIDEREMLDRRMQSYISALAVGGKTLDDALKKDEEKIVFTKDSTSKEQNLSPSEEKDMIRMFQGLGMTHDDVIKGIKTGKMEI